MTKEFLEEALSIALRLRLEIDNGGNRVNLKQRYFRQLEDSHPNGRRLVDLILTLESVFPGRGELEGMIVNISGGNFANFNLGEQVGTINATINSITNHGPDASKLADALSKLLNAVSNDPDLSESQKQEALDLVGTIADQAKLPIEQRKPGTLRAALSYLPTVLSSAASSIKIWEAVGPHLTRFFQ